MLVVDLRADEAFLVPLVDQRRVLQELRVRDADVRRVEVAGLVRAEDVAAEAGEERVHVVRVTLPLLHGEADLRLRLLLRREGLLLEVGERRRDLRELRVRDQRDVLERDGRAVELLDRGAVRERVERVRRELLPRRRRRRQRDDRAVAGELADPVVRADDDVRGGVDRDGGDFLADRARLLLDDLDGDALRAAQALATCVTAGTRSASAQMTILGVWLVAEVPADAATTATSAPTSQTGERSQRAATQHRNALLEERGRCAEDENCFILMKRTPGA